MPAIVLAVSFFIFFLSIVALLRGQYLVGSIVIIYFTLLVEGYACLLARGNYFMAQPFVPLSLGWS